MDETGFISLKKRGQNQRCRNQRYPREDGFNYMATVKLQIKTPIEHFVYHGFNNLFMKIEGIDNQGKDYVFELSVDDLTDRDFRFIERISNNKRSNYLWVQNHFYYNRRLEIFKSPNLPAHPKIYRDNRPICDKKP